MIINDRIMPDGDTDSISIEMLREIVKPIAERNRIVHVRLFGSRARGEYSNDSDYDFLIDAAPDVSLLQMGCFSEELEEALGRPVSLADETMVSDVFMRSIKEDLIEIYSSNPQN